MRILVGAAPPWAKTGYGVQAEALVRRLQRDGHTVAWLPYGEFGGGYWDEGQYQFLPQAPGDFYGNETITAHARAWNPDIVITLIDAWTLANYGGAEFRWVPWVPVDGEPLSHTIAATLPRAWRIAAMSEFGQRQMQAAGFKSTYIPLGFDPAVYYPDANSGREFRPLHGIPDDAFLFGTVGMNSFPDRKGFDRILEAFARFQEGKENVYLYIHSSPLPNKSFDLNQLCDFFGLAENVRFPRPYPLLLGYSNDAMRAMYNAFDCYVSATRGEGFGVPFVEAHACGVPVIATNCTSVPEIVQDTVSGDLVPVKDRFLNLGYYYWSNIDTDALTLAMENMYAEHEMLPNSMFPAGKYHAARFPNLRQICTKIAKRYEFDLIYASYWKPFLDDCQREIEARKPMAVDSRSAAVVEAAGAFVRKTDGPLANVQKEYELLMRLDHPHIIKPLASGTDEYGRFYMDLPRCAGSLAEVSAGDGVLAEIRDALAYLHDRGIAHRDLHPTNVLVSDDGVLLADLGWAAETADPEAVDYRPWTVLQDCVPSVQKGLDQRGYHTIVAHVRGISLADAMATGLPGVPYQQLDGAGERDCALRWEMMKPKVRGKSVLDVGCNLGYFAGRALAEGARVAYGYDKDEATIKAAQKLYPNVHFGVRDIADNGHYSQFDVGFCLSVLQHVPNPEQLLATLRAHVKTLYVEAPDGVVNLEGGRRLGRTDRDRELVVFRA